MKCEKCSSEKVIVQLEQVNAKTNTGTGGILHILYTCFRLFMCLCLIGFFMPKRLSSSKTKYKNKTIALCQNCGFKWEINN